MVDPNYPGATISLGNVFVEHEGATLRCDKAYIYSEKDLIKAMGNVIINQGDTIIQYSKYVDYDANKKLATSWGDVILKDELMILKTDTLYFDREKQHLFYKSGGTIKDTTNLLKSKIGNYYLQTNKFQAFNKVDVTNKDSKLISDHLDYYTSTGIAELYGPSTITSEENAIYTEKGHHNTKTNISHFLKKSKIYYGDRTISGDSLYYNKNIEFASATGNINLIASCNTTLVITGTGANIAGTLNVTGNLVAGNLTTGGAGGNVSGANVVSANTLVASVGVQISNSAVYFGNITTSATTANQTIATLSLSGYVTGVEYLVKGVDATGAKYSVATVVSVTNGTTADFSTFATVNLGGSTGTLSVNIVSGNIALQVTPASSNSTVWTTQYRVI